MNNIVKLTLIIFIPMVSGYAQGQYDDLALDLFNQGIKNIDYRVLTEEERNGVTIWFRKQNYNSHLIRLRDKETLDRLISKYMEIEGTSTSLRRILIESRSPWVLPLIAPALESEEFPIEPRHYGEHGASDLGFAPLTAEIMGSIIRDSPEFPDSIRAEAAKIKGLDPMHTDPWILAAMRDWWAENEELVKQERYTEVTPPTMEGRYEKGWRETYERMTPSPVPVDREIETSTLLKEQHPSPSTTPAPNPDPAHTHTAPLKEKGTQVQLLKHVVIVGLVFLSILVLLLKVTRKKITDHK